MTAVVSGEIEYVRQGGTLTYEGIALLQDIIAGSGGGGGVSDGDKGDVVVSGGGTTWTIEPDAVRAATGYQATVTSGGTTTLTAASADVKVFTGAAAQTIVLPNVTTLTLGRSWRFLNESTGSLTLQSSGLNGIGSTIQSGQVAIVTCIALTGTSATSWVLRFEGGKFRAGNGSTMVYQNSPAFTGVPVFAASALSGASFNAPHGVAPTTPTDGDVWTTTAGIFVRINGATVGPLGAGGGGGGSSPATAWVI